MAMSRLALSWSSLLGLLIFCPSYSFSEGKSSSSLLFCKIPPPPPSLPFSFINNRPLFSLLALRVQIQLKMDFSAAFCDKSCTSKVRRVEVFMRGAKEWMIIICTAKGSSNLRGGIARFAILNNCPFGMQSE